MEALSHLQKQPPSINGVIANGYVINLVYVYMSNSGAGRPHRHNWVNRFRHQIFLC